MLTIQIIVLIQHAIKRLTKINAKKFSRQLVLCYVEKSSKETFFYNFKHIFLMIRINGCLLPSLYTPLSSAVCKVCSRAGVIRCSDVIFRLCPFIDEPSVSEAMLNSPRRKEVGLLRTEIRFLWIWQFESSREICNGWKSLNVS